MSEIATDVVGVGDRLPELALPALDGSTYRLSDLRGRKVLLFMWGSW